jgi:hypothetical protein
MGAGGSDRGGRDSVPVRVVQEFRQMIQTDNRWLHDVALVALAWWPFAAAYMAAAVLMASCVALVLWKWGAIGAGVREPGDR